MTANLDADTPSTIWTPLYRADLEALLDRHEYTTLHLSVLSWLIWLSLLSGDEMFRVLARATESQKVTTKADLSAQIRRVKNLGLIDAITLREPALNRHQRYYATDMGLYLYLSAVNPSPPISIARLAQSYPIERDDLLARLARPHLITDGEPDYRLVSYQQPWHHLFTVANKRHLLVADAALLVQHATGAPYAFLAHVDTGPHQKLADPQAIKPLQQRTTRLFQLGLIETRLWLKQRYDLTRSRACASRC